MDLLVDYLITNDDGIDAAGLQSLYRAVCLAVGDANRVAVVAPDSVRSCCSHGVSTAESIRVEEVGKQMWKVSGTPADCVRVAIKGLRIAPRWVLSGVNEGGNLGVDIHYSGTVAGAREATLLGYRAIALSQYLRRDRPRDWDLSALRAYKTITQLQSQELAQGQFWNVNLPVVDHREPSLPLQFAQPETGMLAFDFEEVQPEYESLDPSQTVGLPTDSNRTEGNHVSSNNAGNSVRWMKYRSNYQDRPRTAPSDVATCFAGFVTATRLSILLPNG
jgi:5'-nucleotidase